MVGVDQPAPAQDLFAGDAALDAFETPVVANMPRGFTTQGQLVSGISSPLTGPATARRIERGLAGAWVAMAARMASSMVW